MKLHWYIVFSLPNDQNIYQLWFEDLFSPQKCIGYIYVPIREAGDLAEPSSSGGLRFKKNPFLPALLCTPHDIRRTIM